MIKIYDSTNKIPQNANNLSDGEQLSGIRWEIREDRNMLKEDGEFRRAWASE